MNKFDTLYESILEQQIDEDLKKLYLKFQSDLKYRITAKEIGTLVSDLHGIDRDKGLKKLRKNLQNIEFFKDVKTRFKKEYNVNISKLFIVTMINYFLEHEHENELTDIIYNKVYGKEVIKYVLKNKLQKATT